MAHFDKRLAREHKTEPTQLSMVHLYRVATSVHPVLPHEARSPRHTGPRFSKGERSKRGSDSRAAGHEAPSFKRSASETLRISGLMHRRGSHSFDHLVCASEQRCGDYQAERLGGLKVDVQ